MEAPGLVSREIKDVDITDWQVLDALLLGGHNIEKVVVEDDILTGMCTYCGIIVVENAMSLCAHKIARMVHEE